VSFRVGQGFDAHRLVTGRPLLLGGVQVPYERGLEGHSDGDFPSSDPRWRGASSRIFLAEVKKLVSSRGYVVANVDATVIAEAPALAAHLPGMRRVLADALGLALDAVSVKAKSADRLGALGRGEGIAAQAVCLLRREEARA
jgi:2C-methyl-D-erythritol 2,4-cyclodiphosphate synthase